MSVPTTVLAMSMPEQLHSILRQVFDDPALRRAKRSCDASGLFKPREKMFLQLATLEKIVEWAATHKSYNKFVALFLLAYAYLLRVPSEALPVITGRKGNLPDAQAVLYKDNQELVLTLKRRKNKPFGSVLTRRCWCGTSPQACPVHVFGKLVDSLPPGTRLFKGVTPGRALAMLRFILEQIGTPRARLYRTHDLRRGHALDLQLSGPSQSMCMTFHCMHTVQEPP